MKRTSLLSLAALLVAGAAPAAAQAPKIGGLVQVWWNLSTPSQLRNNSSAASYYNLRSEFKENGFSIRRTELKFSGKILDGVEYEAMIDPSISPSTTNSILQDASITWKSPLGLDFKMGQMKAFQTYEGLNSSSELLTVERSQMGRTIGDVRQRGVAAIYAFGDAKSLAGKVVFGAFNGNVKGNDANAQKDWVARLEFQAAKDHRFGLYTLQGSSDLSDKDAAPLQARTFVGAVNGPTAREVVDNKDKTSHVGAFYVFQTSEWHLSAEAVTGLLGRGYGIASTSTLVNAAAGANQDTFNAAAASRQHLDQRFMGFVLTGAYTFGNHTLLARYDAMNYNQGDKWYTAANPYKTAVVDYSPKYTELTLGYLYALKPESLKAANFKLNYIARSKNFLKPSAAAGETSEQGGNTIVAAFQVAF